MPSITFFAPKLVDVDVDRGRLPLIAPICAVPLVAVVLAGGPSVFVSEKFAERNSRESTACDPLNATHHSVAT
ncbi:MAG: hypothetical protein DMG30_24380 [Acidobacteria bacterium]|nr:MAG: hypothetical protein DMG30_24380 [Acidobacteriota bacterium]